MDAWLTSSPTLLLYLLAQNKIHLNNRVFSKPNCRHAGQRQSVLFQFSMQNSLATCHFCHIDLTALCGTLTKYHMYQQHCKQPRLVNVYLTWLVVAEYKIKGTVFPGRYQIWKDEQFTASPLLASVCLSANRDSLNSLKMLYTVWVVWVWSCRTVEMWQILKKLKLKL